MIKHLKHQCIVISLAISAVSIGYVETVCADTIVESNGVLGVGLNLSESFTLSINGRLQRKSNGLRWKHGFSSDSNASFNNVDQNNVDQRTYDDYRLNLSSFAAMIDWHPGWSGFRVSAGLLHKGKQADSEAHSVTDTNFLVGDRGYTAYGHGSLTDRIDSDSTAPYLGIGWRNKADKRGGFSFSAEAGLLFQGSTTSRLHSQSYLITDSDYLQEEGDFEDFLDNVEIYPVLNLGISYTY